MFELIKRLFKGFLMFGIPTLMALCVWIVLEPSTFEQNLITLIFAIVVSSLSLVAICLVLNELGD